MGYHFAYHTDIGKRESNQDSLVIKSYSKNGKKAFLAAVCDGLGGLSRGEVNSRKAAQILSNWFEGVFVPVADGTDRPEYMEEQMEMLLRTINRSLFNDNRAAGSPGGTTMSALLLWNGERFIAHIGDSRIYEIRNGEVRQLTRDHTTRQMLLDMGNEEAARGCNASEIMCCLGGGVPDYLDRLSVTKVFERNTPQFLLMTTDGIHDVLTMDEMELLLAGDGTLQEKAERLCLEAANHGSEDDCSAILVNLG